MNNIFTRVAIQLEGQKHTSFSSTEENGTKGLFEKIKGLGSAEYYTLKTLKVGQAFTIQDRNFVITNIVLTHSATNQFGDNDNETLDIHLIVKES